MHSEIAFGQRRAGVLLHIGSLPEGTLGASAYRFVDFLAAGGFSVWQVLPLLPVDASGSPYQPLSLFAGDAELLDAPLLCAELGLDTADAPSRWAAIHRAHARIAQLPALEGMPDFDAFRQVQRSWLEPFALFAALRARYHGEAWTRWAPEHRDAGPGQWQALRAGLHEAVEVQEVAQYLFERQWQQLKRYANARGVYLFGDLPFYAAEDSADVWAERAQFRLGADGRPALRGGVPPDAFSDSGQSWGAPVFDWAYMRADNFSWWIARMARQLELFDLLRIDHFRGLEAYWAIPADAPDARSGEWLPGPGDALLQKVRATFGQAALVAEDLGTITEAVSDLRRRFQLPGMRVLQFAFDGNADNPHLPANHASDTVVYTGTHDNDTSLGWWQSADEATQERVRALGEDSDGPMPWPLIRMSLRSVATLAVVPMQDLLALDSSARLNRPGTIGGSNWQWRMTAGTDLGALAGRMAPILQGAGRGG